MHLGIKAVIAKSFARIHKANLVNFGIIPCEFENVQDYDNIDFMDELVIENTYNLSKDPVLVVQNKTKGTSFKVKTTLSKEDVEILKAGGALNYIRNQQ